MLNRNKYEKNLVDDGFDLPSSYFKDSGGFSFSQRPHINIPKNLVNNKTHISYSQEQITNILVSGTVSIANNILLV
jgi:hypothetical protein